ncbi:unnamed protein product [Rotaria sordida]|uniref:Uncharacterized protein n=1 Tax=Rotaria sordida TaxID=392033 RepID=A0A815AGP3_9BILA|nr:unnamed protein product [Rotaria sordida]CAF1536091.1 unnamed protein product [Rotaria sordida]
MSKLIYRLIGIFTCNTGPYNGRYSSANLHDNGVWYQSTYGLLENDGPCQNWCVQRPFISFQNDTDNLFNQSSYNRQKIKYGALHFVDFDDIDKAQPLFTFTNKTGTVTVSYIPALEKCLMVISIASYPGICSMVKEFDIYILESNYIEDS